MYDVSHMIIAYYFPIYCMQMFHDTAYSAVCQDDIMDAIDNFLDNSIVLPPGDWDQDLLLPIMQERNQLRRRKGQCNITAATVVLISFKVAVFISTKFTGECGCSIMVFKTHQYLLFIPNGIITHTQCCYCWSNSSVTSWLNARCYNTRLMMRCNILPTNFSSNV